MQEKRLIKVRNIEKEFKVKRGVVKAVSDMSLDIYRGETLALVGESGCGKSTLGRIILQTIKADRGEVWFDGTELGGLSRSRMREMRSRMQLIFQDPYASLDPRMCIRQIIAEPLKAFKIPQIKQDRIIRELCEKTGIPEGYLGRYPHEFSGGQRQRIGIARALAIGPEFVVCDEPVSALDVSIQAQTLNLLAQLQTDMQLTYLFISHDMGVVRYISDRVCVMFLGQICEIGDTEDIFEHPRHPYTKLLLESTPKIGKKMKIEQKDNTFSEIQSALNPPSGCRFRIRCPYAKDICANKKPELGGENGHLCACYI